MEKEKNKAFKIKIVAMGLILMSLTSGCVAIETQPHKIGEVGEVIQQTIQSSENIFKPGEIAEMNNVQIALLGYRESTGSEWVKPADGKVFLLAEFEIVNNSNEDVNVSSMLSFEGYCDDYVLEYSLGAIMEDDITQFDGTISPGKRMKGHIGWEVPKNWGNVEIHFTDNVWSDRKIKFLIEK